MKKMIKPAFINTIPVMTGYLVLGIGFGVMLKAGGYGILWALIMSITMYAGSMQYVAVTLLTSGASLFTSALTTVMVNARHIFYGISMLPKYKGMGKRKLYMIFALTDETYSLLCHDNPDIPEDSKEDYCFLVSLFNHCYWITGCVLGAFLGTVIKFNSEGIDFVLTALFITVFIEQWKSERNHVPALIGVGASVICLLIFGGENFLIPAMLTIGVLLCVIKEKDDE